MSNVLKPCLACSSMTFTGIDQTPVCAGCRSVRGLAGADELEAVRAQLAVAVTGAKAYWDELQSLGVFDCPACRAQIDTRDSNAHEPDCPIAQTLGLETFSVV